MDPQLLFALTLVIGFCLLIVAIITAVNNSYKRIEPVGNGLKFVDRLNVVSLHWGQKIDKTLENYLHRLDRQGSNAQHDAILTFRVTIIKIWTIFNKSIQYLLRLTKPEHSVEIHKATSSNSQKPDQIPDFELQSEEQPQNSANDYRKPDYIAKEEELIALMQKASRDEKMYIALDLGELYGQMNQPEEQHELYKWVLENATGDAKILAKNKMLAL